VENIKGDAIKYLSIELVKKDANATDADKIESGLFKGIRELEYEVEGEVNTIVRQEFLLVVPPKEESNGERPKTDDDKYLSAFSVDTYNILSFTAFDGAVRHIIFMKCDELDQSAAMKIIRGIMLRLKDAGRMTSAEGIIDVSTYSELPESFNDPIRNTVGMLNRTSQATQNTPNVTTGTTNVNSATTTVTTGYYVKKPFYLKRTSDKPKPTFIKELSLLLDKLSDKDYIDKPFKKVEKDTDDKVQETDIPKAGSIGTEVDEDHQMRWMGGCC